MVRAPKAKITPSESLKIMKGTEYHVVIFEDVGDPPSEHFDTKGFDDEESLFAFLKDMAKGEF
jgi:hypothetical protein